MSEPGGLASNRFSTDALPERDRVAYWREFFGRHVMRLDMEPAKEEPLRFAITQQWLGGVGVATAQASGYRCRRTTDLLGDGNNAKVLLIPRGRRLLARQRGREAVVETDEALLSTMDEVVDVVMPAMSGAAPAVQHVHVILPHEALAPLVPDLDDAFPKAIPAHNEALRLLRNYIGLLSAGDGLVTAHTAHAIAGHIRDLSVLAIGGSRDAEVAARRGGLGAARLAAVQALIRESLGDPGLTLTEVAKRSRISPGYVRKLFAGDGTSFSDYVLAQRLEHARRMLAGREFAHLRISDIAYGCGFGDLSYFNRAFRRRFGATPSDVRAGGAMD